MPISIKQKRSSRVRYTLKKRNKDRLRMSVFKSAKNLYTILRKIKKDGYKKIAVEKIQNKGIGKTINDRLNRASKY